MQQSAIRRRLFTPALAAACLVLSSSSVVVACLWDYDTLWEERAQFPGVLELITGKFIRHSTKFYEWRIENRKERLAQEPNNLALYDDLAVAYDKTGNQAQAIATILKKESLEPGKYETAANLGTFHIHAGNFSEGLTHINRAIEINPAAHFGREVYQKLLVEYVVKYSKDGKVSLPIVAQQMEENWVDNGAHMGAEMGIAIGFGDFVLQQRPQPTPAAERTELRRATKGILGMMRFGHHDSPVLLEALGMLLLSDTVASDGDAKRLATRAFLKASYESKDETVAAAYRKIAQSSIQGQTRNGVDHQQIPLSKVESQFKSELKEAKLWFERGIVRDEADWIAAGKDADAMFDAKYRVQPALAASANDPVRNSLLRNPGIVVIWLIVGLLVTIAVFAFVVWLFLKRMKRTQQQV
jgi:tetratricopeptide (TPR) repeat protein